MLKVVLCTILKEQAEKLAQLLISKQLAACVNIIPSVQSVYHWEGKVEYEEESLLIIKTSEQRLQELKEEIEKEHPYDIPEILVFEPDFVNQPYLEWINNYVKKN